MLDITHEQASQRILYAAENNLLVQAEWQNEREGRHLACLLGSIDRSVQSTEDCPGHLMTPWMANTTIELFDSLSSEAIVPIGRRYGKLIGKWGSLIDEKWHKIETAFQNYMIDYVVEQAKPFCEKTTIWLKLEAECQQAKIELLPWDNTLEESVQEDIDISIPLNAMYVVTRDEGNYATHEKITYAIDVSGNSNSASMQEASLQLFTKLLDIIEEAIGGERNEGAFSLSFC